VGQLNKQSFDKLLKITSQELEVLTA